LRKSITVIMMELLTLSRATSIWPQRDVVKYIRSAIALDGLVKSFAPQFNVGRHLESVCNRHLHWHPLRTIMMPRTILSWLDASYRLARDGMPRTVAMMTQRQMSPAIHRSRVANGSPAGLAAVRVSALALLASILSSLDSGTKSFALGFRSASVVIAVLSAVVALFLIGRAHKGFVTSSTGCRNIS
jgi:hypothetical protein